MSAANTSKLLTRLETTFFIPTEIMIDIKINMFSNIAIDSLNLHK